MMVDLEAPNVDVSRTPTLTHTRQALKRNIVQILSQNALGLDSDDQIKEITLMLHKSNIFICCIQETWRTEPENLEGDSRYKSLLSAQEIRTSNRGSLGVDITLSPNDNHDCKAAGCEIQRSSARVMVVRLAMVALMTEI